MKSRQFANGHGERERIARVVVALAARTDLPYGVALLETIPRCGAESHLVIRGDAAAALGARLAAVRGLAAQTYAEENQAARISSGSFLTLGMVVAPCDGASLGAIVMGLATNLVHRAADVTLKEARPLVLGVPPAELARVPADILERAAVVPGLRIVPLAGAVEDAVPELLAQLGIDCALVGV